MRHDPERLRPPPPASRRRLAGCGIMVGRPVGVGPDPHAARRSPRRRPLPLRSLLRVTPMATIQSFTELLLTEAAVLVRDVYVPLGGTCILLGGVGAVKSQVFAQLGRELEDADPEFGF